MYFALIFIRFVRTRSDRLQRFDCIEKLVKKDSFKIKMSCDVTRLPATNIIQKLQFEAIASYQCIGDVN